MVDNYDSTTQAVINKKDEDLTVDETVKINRQINRLKGSLTIATILFAGTLGGLAWFFYNSQQELTQQVNLIQKDRQNLEQINSVKQQVQNLEQKIGLFAGQQEQLAKQIKSIQGTQLPTFTQQLKQLDSNLNSLRQQRTEVVENKLKEINSQLQKIDSNIKKK